LGGGAFSDTPATGITGEAGYFVLGDFNNDGKLDIAMQLAPPFQTLNVSLRVFFGNGDGTFSAGPITPIQTNAFQTFQLVAGDFDHDGNLDIAGVNGDTEPGHVAMLYGDGKGTFTVQPINGPMGFGLLTGDINGDGLPDLLIPDRFGLLTVALGRTDRNFPSVLAVEPASLFNPATVGDVTNDGRMDLFVPGSPTSEIYLNQGNGSFVPSGTPPQQGFLLADLNGDGFADLIGTDGTNLIIWPGTGDPNFQGSNPIIIPPPAGSGFPNSEFIATEVQVADMDGDGRLDLVMPNLVLFNDGNFQFTAVELNYGYDGPWVVGDFNGDGLLDIASGTTTLLQHSGRTFSSISPNNLNLVPGQYTAVGDFNRDGKTDVVSGGNEYPILVSYSMGDGTFYTQSVLDIGVTSDFTQAPVVGDFNGDGWPDIVACLFYSEQCIVYTNDGQGGFQRSYFASGANTVSAVGANWNGDGKLGLAITNYLLDYAPPNVNLVFHK
jgi:FG-GAP-like repeat